MSILRKNIVFWSCCNIDRFPHKKYIYIYRFADSLAKPIGIRTR